MHSCNVCQSQQDLSLNLTATDGSRPRWFARWDDSGSAPSTPPNRRVPAADATKPRDTDNSKNSQANCSQSRSSTCSARKVAPRPFVEGWKQNRQAFSNNLTQPPNCGWLRGSCNCFRRVLVCKLFAEEPKEGCNRSLAHHLSQPPNPLPTRPLGSYSSPVAIGLSAYEIQSLQLLTLPRIPMLE